MKLRWSTLPEDARTAPAKPRLPLFAGAPLLIALAMLASCNTLHQKQTVQAPPPPPPPPALGKLQPADVQVAFGTGSSFTETVVGGKTYRIVLNPDSSAKRTPNGSTASESGTWRAANTGYCAKWGTAAEQCYTISRTAPNTYDILDAKNAVIAHMST